MEPRTRTADPSRLDMTDANCRTSNRDIFFPDKPGRGVYVQARKICFACPIRVACLEHELRLGTRANVAGMFGGKTPEERQQIISLRRKGTA